MKSTVILAMYNEEKNASLIVKHLDAVRKKFSLDLGIIAVNDGSKDNTETILKGLQNTHSGVTVISYAQNRGMGKALRIGIAKAVEERADILIFMDADLTHDGNDIPKFLQKIAGGYDLVLGSRFIPGGKMVGVPLLRVLISKLGNEVGKILLRVPVKDLTTGFRAGKRTVFEKIVLTETGFGIQLEETVLAAVAGFRLGEVPIVLTTRQFGHSKMIYNGKLFLSYFSLLFKCVRLRHTKARTQIP
jgi:glycosyltransferase involved in cell wall biosynthesis